MAMFKSTTGAKGREIAQQKNSPANFPDKVAMDPVTGLPAGIKGGSGTYADPADVPDPLTLVPGTNPFRNLK